MERQVDELTEVSYTQALKIWFSFMWRTVVFSMLLGVGVGIIVAIIDLLLGTNLAGVLILLAVPVYLIVPGVIAVRSMVKLRYSDFRLMAVKNS